MSESFGIPGWLLEKLDMKFQLEEIEKKLDQKIEIMKIQLIVIDAAVKDETVIVIN